jgi:hypothetical protein
MELFWIVPLKTTFLQAKKTGLMSRFPIVGIEDEEETERGDHRDMGQRR